MSDYKRCARCEHILHLFDPPNAPLSELGDPREYLQDTERSNLCIRCADHFRQREAATKWAAIYEAEGEAAQRRFERRAKRVDAMIAKLAAGEQNHDQALRARDRLEDTLNAPELRSWQPAHDACTARMAAIRAAFLKARESGSAARAAARDAEILRLRQKMADTRHARIVAGLEDPPLFRY